MDHISRALERAQSERRSVRSWVRPTTTAIAQPEGRDLATAGSVELSSAHLLARHILSGLGDEDPAVSDRYRLLRTRVIHALRYNRHNVLGVTSPGPKDGKSLTSINLAISIAREGGHSVVLVDSDLRKPSIGGDLGITAERGLIDYLSTDIDIDAVLLGTNIPNLFIVPGRPEHSDVAVPELLSSPKMERLIAQFRGVERYIVVVDLPPVRLGDDVLALAPMLDGILLVVREAGTTVDELRESAELLRESTIIGTVLNQSTDKKLHFEGYYYTDAAERK